jgi:hypothetical protein
MLKRFRRVVAKCHRRYGKGTTVFVHAFEEALKRKITVRYGAETQLQANRIFKFLIDQIFYKCPELKPKKKGDAYVLPTTGSQFFIFGVKDSGEADKARGEEADIIICDEYAFWKFKANYILTSVLLPQLDQTGGQLIITSTPPEDLTHDYIAQVAIAEAKGYLFSWTIMDSLRIGELSQKRLDYIIAQCGGADTDSFKREYMCDLIANKNRLVIPEASLYADSLFLEQAPPRPAYFDAYVCMDLGLCDFHATVFGYLDFLNSQLIFDNEYVDNYKSSQEISENCKQMEIDGEYVGHIHKRIGDNELQQLHDMARVHDYHVTPITKRSKQSGKGFRDSVINGFREGIKNDKIKVVTEKCPQLSMQLKYGIWNEHRTDFLRTDHMGHLDALMAGCYSYDNINWTKNPYPHPYTLLNKSENFIPKLDLEKANKTYQMKKLLGR